MRKTLFTAALLASFVPFATTALAASATPGQTQKGVASYYHDSLNGNKTASGQIYNKNRLSAAHKTLPLGTKVRVTDTKTGRSIVVKVNDRGPFVKGRIIDLSKAAARKLGIVKRGVAKVEVKVLSTPKG
ncbi:septal ring lytic transglycosylase RlpA family protein [Thiorhodococcus mannitoliphagus]|uniref:Endolytic peptidoglycan transglycosylase RlpA n=1 Tax=Thiorhodococcus mannitoliphagus TaxID=329406 RepID=A0A6P1DW51_9GAMM|nr:septal ring lytic transglycosylase RlpA family protein [Thiorhodococcus mannitoliphagus]NEX20332.1 septal ring lytic transglycosylase RlpA family protein [Thiorhodococcus mannitoliphagus]